MGLFRRSTLLGIALLTLGTSAVRAEESAEPARFLLETITVEGPKQAAANIVRAETLLEEGRSYTEGELRQAVDRVQRLPFVLDATFALRKGSERGAYELAVEVQTARWFFFDQWSRGFYLQEPLGVNPGNPEGASYSESLEGGVGGLAGVRRFVGRSGVVFATLDTEQGAQIGFTRYDLFHRGILFSASFSQANRDLPEVAEVLPLALDPTFAVWTFDDSSKLSLGLSVPFGGRQSVQVAISERRGGVESRGTVLRSSPFTFPTYFSRDGEVTYRTAEGKWVWDTSDDPLLPTRGTSLSAGIEAARFQGEGLRPGRFSPFEPPLPAFESEQAVLAFSAIHHWSITPRQTVSATGRAAVGQSNVEGLFTGDAVLPVEATLDYSGGSLGLRHSLVLKRSREPGDVSDLRLETGVEAGAERTSPDLGPGLLRRFSASVGIVFRNQWGRVRAILTYLDLQGDAR